MLLKTRDFAGTSQEVLDVLLQLVQDGAACLIHRLGPFEVRSEPFELFTQSAILIVHWQPSGMTAGPRRMGESPLRLEQPAMSNLPPPPLTRSEREGKRNGH